MGRRNRIHGRQHWPSCYLYSLLGVPAPAGIATSRPARISATAASAAATDTSGCRPRAMPRASAIASASRALRAATAVSRTLRTMSRAAAAMIAKAGASAIECALSPIGWRTSLMGAVALREPCSVAFCVAQSVRCASASISGQGQAGCRAPTRLRCRDPQRARHDAGSAPAPPARRCGRWMPYFIAAFFPCLSPRHVQVCSGTTQSQGPIV